MNLLQSNTNDYSRDTASTAIVNTNKSAYNAHLSKKKQNARVNKIECEVADIKNELTEIRSLLLQIVNR